LGCLGYDAMHCGDYQHAAGTCCFHLQCIRCNQYLPLSKYLCYKPQQSPSKCTGIYGLINRILAVQPNLAVERAALVLCPETSASNFGRRPATLVHFYWFSPFRTTTFGTGHNCTLLHSCSTLFTNQVVPSDATQSELPTV
jgi:hypothetical protein